MRSSQPFAEGLAVHRRTSLDRRVDSSPSAQRCLDPPDISSSTSDAHDELDRKKDRHRRADPEKPRGNVAESE